MLKTVSLSVMLLIAAAAPAAASTASYTPPFFPNGREAGDRDPSELNVRGKSETNRITLAKSGKRHVITDKAGVKAGKRCKQKSRKRVTCPRAETVFVTLGKGNDRVDDGGLRADVDGGAGDDRLVGGGSLRGEAGNDTLISRKGIDTQTVEGGPGDDRLIGGDNHEVLIGGDGRDTLDGGAGNDQLDGDDDISEAIETDVIEGGDGVDTLEWGFRDAAVTFNTTDEAPEGEAGENEQVTGVENVETGAGDDVLVGGPENNDFDAGEGSDSVTTGEGDDVFANDYLADTLIDLGPGSDTVRYDRAFTSEGPPAVRVDLSDPAPDGNAGFEETLTGVENIVGTTEDDVLIGDAGPNVIDGGDGCDTIQGLGGDDTLKGDKQEVRDCSDDRIEGGDGNDRLTGGDGADMLFGGLGDDVFATRDIDVDEVDCGEGSDSGKVDKDDKLTASCEAAVVKK